MRAETLAGPRWSGGGFEAPKASGGGPTVGRVLAAGLGRLGGPASRDGRLEGGTGVGHATTARLPGGFVDPPRLGGVEEGELACHAL